ncbi:O-antigen ligase [Novosphingobium sp. Chol11]|uniref:O-antigen ligase family protein n=1 Tax=Novosphingobium sp. Chol11 TaxID=1385763 RepID=UPI0025F8CF94|nr:O-antigen ligase family protein [Novosphingobium sp. Chol11]
MAMVGASMVLGGGGIYNPQTEIMLELVVVACMIPLCISSSFNRGLGPISPMAWLLAGIVLWLPLAQLIPLPPALWQALPGRDIEVKSIALAGNPDRWMPLSMAPARTFTALLSMIFPALLMLQVSRLPIRSRRWLCATIAAVGALSIVLGMLQISRTGGSTWSLYSYVSTNSLIGFQANRNHEADLLHIALLAFCALIAPRLMDGRRHLASWFAVAGAIVIFLTGVLMTGSRTGIALSALTLALILALVWPALRKNLPSAPRLLAGSLALAAVAFGLLQLNSVHRVMLRFWFTDDARSDLWIDAANVLHQVWPLGAGIGTIAPLLAAAERLDALGPTFPNRVHNDWFEWMIEAGVPGIAVLVLVLLILAILAYRAFRLSAAPDSAPARRSQTIFAIGALLIVALHSIVDYPLRSMALAMLASMAAGFLMMPARSRPGGGSMMLWIKTECGNIASCAGNFDRLSDARGTILRERKSQ